MRDAWIISITIVVAVLISCLAWYKSSTRSKEEMMKLLDDIQLSSKTKKRFFIGVDAKLAESQLEPSKYSDGMLHINVVNEPKAEGHFFLGDFYGRDIFRETIHFTKEDDNLVVIMKGNVLPSRVRQNEIRLFLNDLLSSNILEC